MAGNANSGRRAKPVIDPMTGLELPAGAILPPKNSSVVDASLERQDELRNKIAEILQNERGDITESLSWAAVQFDGMRAFRENVSLAKRGPKPHIDCQWLLIECAQIYERVRGEPVDHVLASLIEVDANRDHHINWFHSVIRWAGAVLIATDADKEIGRRQVEGAIERHKANTR